MISKKSDSANLEKNKRFFLEIGLATSLLIVFLAFSYTSADTSDAVNEDLTAAKEDTEMVEVTRDEPEQPKPEIEKPVDQPQSTEIEETNDRNEDQSSQVQNNDDQTAQIQSFDDSEVNETVHIRVEKMPAFPGGNGALLRFIGENLVYPSEAVDMGLEGNVIVKFVVGKDGKAKNPEILKGVAPLLDKAAMDVILKLPLFTPGEQAGEKVPVYFNLPVQFKVQK